MIDGEAYCHHRLSEKTTGPTGNPFTNHNISLH